MKLVNLHLILILTGFVGGEVWASGSASKAQGTAPVVHDHSKMKDSAGSGKNITLKGELIGLTCMIKHGTTGGSHGSCAKECAKKGLPIALKADGKIYQITGSGHDSLVEAYKPLLKYIESKVIIKGDVFESEGVRLLVIKKIKKDS